MELNYNGLYKKIIITLSVLSLIISSLNFFYYLSATVKKNAASLGVFAASFALPGKSSVKKVKINAPAKLHTEVVTLSNKKVPYNNTGSFLDKQMEEIVKNIPSFEVSHTENENTYKITECLFGACGTKCENFFVNNKTNLNIDFKSKLSEKPDIPMQKNGEPEVLIVHTHTTESYMDKDQDFYYQSFRPRTTDCRYNVVQVGNALCKSLENSGIKTIHDTTCHDDPSYTGSYSRSANTIDKNLRQYPSIKVILDIHRDTMENKERSKIKPTFSINGKKAAQIMIIAGCDTDGKLNHPDWEYNLRFALNLNRQIETMYPGMSRALLFKHARYNMHKSHGSLLIEVGSDANTLNEAVYSGALLGKALSEVLNKLTN